MRIEFTDVGVFNYDKPKVIIHTGFYSKEAYERFDKLLAAEHSPCAHETLNTQYAELSLMPQNISIGNWMDDYIKNGHPNARYKYVGIDEDGEIFFHIPPHADVFRNAATFDDKPTGFCSKGSVKTFDKLLEVEDHNRNINVAMLWSDIYWIFVAYVNRFTEHKSDAERYAYRHLVDEMRAATPTDTKLIGVPFNPLQMTMHKAIREEIQQADDDAYEVFSTKHIPEAPYANLIKWVDARVNAYDRLEQLYDC